MLMMMIAPSFVCVYIYTYFFPPITIITLFSTFYEKNGCNGVCLWVTFKIEKRTFDGLNYESFN